MLRKTAASALALVALATLTATATATAPLDFDALAIQTEAPTTPEREKAETAALQQSSNTGVACCQTGCGEFCTLRDKAIFRLTSGSITHMRARLIIGLFAILTR